MAHKLLISEFKALILFQYFLFLSSIAGGKLEIDLAYGLPSHFASVRK